MQPIESNASLTDGEEGDEVQPTQSFPTDTDTAVGRSDGLENDVVERTGGGGELTRRRDNKLGEWEAVD